MTDTREHTLGLWYGVGAYLIWGLSPLYWNLVDDIPAIDLLLQRIVWAIPILAITITARRMWPSVRDDYRPKRAIAITTVAAFVLSINWGLFLWAVTSGHVVEASLGYFINPLVSVALGVIVLGERLTRVQWVAVAIAALGVLGMGLRVGAVPWISLTLAFSFGLYGLLKKQPLAPRPLGGLLGEVAIAAVPATFVLLFVRDPLDLGVDLTVPMVAFLIGTGAITVAPLLLFGEAAQRIKLATVGLLQYIAPTLQLLIGVAVLGESLSSDQLFGFVMVWIALVLYTVDNVRTAARRQPAAA